MASGEMILCGVDAAGAPRELRVVVDDGTPVDVENWVWLAGPYAVVGSEVEEQMLLNLLADLAVGARVRVCAGGGAGRVCVWRWRAECVGIDEGDLIL